MGKFYSNFNDVGKDDPKDYSSLINLRNSASLSSLVGAFVGTVIAAMSKEIHVLKSVLIGILLGYAFGFFAHILIVRLLKKYSEKQNSLENDND